jgi:hypothetical protein
MSNNRLLVYLMGIVAFFISLSNAQHTKIVKEKQYYTERLEVFFRPIKYTQSSIQCFLKHTFNNPNYAQRFLSLNFSHVYTFLSYTNQSELPRTYIKSVLKLFNQKLKSTTYINAYAFLELLDTMPDMLKNFFVPEKNLNDKKDLVKQCLYDFLLNNFKDLKENPDAALSSLSDKIIDITENKKQEDISIEELQYTISQFLDTALSKFIWSPEDQQEIWESVKITAHKLESLLINNMIPNTETLDDLYWSLIHRYCYFLEMAGSELKPDCYTVMNTDLATKKLSLWYLDEQEAYITTKAERLKHSLIDAEVRSRAFHAGLITDMISPKI